MALFSGVISIADAIRKTQNKSVSMIAKSGIYVIVSVKATKSTVYQ
jgi:hypothetical protein